MENIYIVAASEDSYSQHLGVMLCSIFENKARDTIIKKIFILDGGISEKNKIKLNNLSLHYGHQLSFIEMNRLSFKKFSLGGKEERFRSMFYRISITEIIDKKVDKILYLDSDIVIQGDLNELWETDISNYYLAAVLDPYAENIQKVYPSEVGKYFNSGVMLVNLKKWREDKIYTKLLIFLNKHFNDLVFPDQDALNFLLREKCLHLDPKNNCMTYFFDMKGTPNSFNKEEFELAIEKPLVIHYTGEPKPWNLHSKHKFRSVYKKYLWKTPWRFYIPSEIRYKFLKYKYLNKHPSIYSLLKILKRIAWLQFND